MAQFCVWQLTALICEIQIKWLRKYVLLKHWKISHCLSNLRLGYTSNDYKIYSLVALECCGCDKDKTKPKSNVAIVFMIDSGPTMLFAKTECVLH